MSDEIDDSRKRVLVDVNVFISYLWSPDSSGNIQELVEAIYENEITLLVFEDLFEELRSTVQRKKHLAARITLEQVEELIADLLVIGEQVPAISEPFPQVVRDLKDDYLLAYALVGQADYIVTGDEDLLVLQQVDTLSIVSISDFVAILHKEYNVV
jgi:hypothetical protein